MELLLSSQQLDLTLRRLSLQIVENFDDLSSVVFVGLQPRGIKISERIVAHIRNLSPEENILYGKLDITFYRDDFKKELLLANKTDIPFSIEDKIVILIDDVLYTGRTIRAALDALQDFGRPEKVELCVLVDRRFNRQFPIQPDYCGKSIDSSVSQKVKIDWDKEEVILY